MRLKPLPTIAAPVTLEARPQTRSWRLAAAIVGPYDPRRRRRCNRGARRPGPGRYRRAATRSNEVPFTGRKGVGWASAHHIALRNHAQLSPQPCRWGSYFFTVNLLDRRSNLLVAEIGALRDAVRTRGWTRPFHIDAWVVLPDHLHCLWTLPPDDADFPNRWRTIKALFSRRVAHPRRSPSPPWSASARPAFGSVDIGNTRSAPTATMQSTWTTSISTL